jgi:O-antigen ligase
MFAVQFTLYRVMERFLAVDPMEDTRVLIARITIEAAKAYMPFGSGMGTFVPVYAMYEKPQDAMVNVYANHAHDDVLELWLETGVVGIVLMGVFMTWLVLRSINVWRRAPLGGREIDRSLARAGTLIIGLLVAHSFLDYPLRTDAMMAIMAFACALLIEPPTPPACELQAIASNTDMRRKRQPAVSAVTAEGLGSRQVRGRTAASATIPPRQPAELLGENMDWPEAWREPAKPASSGTASRGPLNFPKPRDD